MVHLTKKALSYVIAGAMLITTLGGVASAQSPTTDAAASPAAAATVAASPAADASPAAAASPATAPAATPAPPDSVAYPPGANAGSVTDLTWPVPADATSINPDGKNKVTNDELIANVAHNKISINVVWTLITGFLVMFMQAGFALVETGLCRAKSAAHVMATNFMIYGLGMLGFWVCGFAFMFGNYCERSGRRSAGSPRSGRDSMLLNQRLDRPSLRAGQTVWACSA